MIIKKKIMISIIAMLTIALIIPVRLVNAQVGNTDTETTFDIGDIIPTDNTVGPTGIVDELNKAHAVVTDIMIFTTDAIANTGYVDEEVYLEAVYVDEENQTLVIWLDPAQAFDPLDVEDIQEELGIFVPIEINYGFFVTEASSSEATSCPADSGSSICYYWGRYVDRCLPSITTSRCNTYSTIITSAGYALPTLLGSNPVPLDTDGDGINDSVDQCVNQPETINGYQDTDGCPDTIPVIPTGGTIFSDDFENGFSKWIETGQQEWQTGTLDESATIPGYTRYNIVAEADDCDDEPCILSMAQTINLSNYDSATLSFDRFVDNSLDLGEYLAVEIGNNGVYTEVLRWTDRDGDDDRWHSETVNLASYLNSGFNVRFVTEESSSSEDVAIDNVIIRGEGSSACVLSVSAILNGDTITAQWNDCGEDIIRYKAYLYENGSYDRYLGSVYGTSVSYSYLDEGSSYLVKVKAQYAETYRYTELFSSNSVTVPVVDRAAPRISVPSNIAVDATSSNGATVNFVVSAYDSVDGSVHVTCNYSSGDLFAVGDTTVTCTARDNARNVASENFVVTVNEYVSPEPMCDESPSGQSGDSCPVPELQCIIGGQPASGINCVLFDGLEEGLKDLLKLPNTISDGNIMGGTPIVVHSERYDPQTPSIPMTSHGTGTVGIVLNGTDGNIRILTASHVANSNSGTDDVRIHTLLSPFSGISIGYVEQDTNFINPRNNGNPADAALIVVTNQDVATHPNKIKYNDEVLTVTGFGGVSDIGYMPIYIAGIHNDGVGAVQYQNVTLNIGINGYTVTLIEQVSGSYPSTKGDSGAPIFTRDGDDATLLGIHVAASCRIILDNGNILDLIYNNEGILVCDSEDNPVFHIMTPWENIAENLSVQ